MSEHYTNYKKANGCNYYISTVEAFDAGWETMIFLCDEFNQVVDWKDKYRENYIDEDEAIEGHKFAIENLEKCLKEWEERYNN